MELVIRARPAMLRFATDVIHVHNSFTAALCLAGIGGAKVLSLDHYMFQGSDRPITKRIYRRALTSFDLLMPVSDFCAQAAADYWSLPLQDLRVLYSGVAAARSPGVADRTRPGGRLVIGYVGQLRDQAETDILTEAVNLVKTVHPGATLMVAGGQAAPDLFRSVDIWVMADQHTFETTAAKALSVGKPVICSGCGRLGDAGPRAAAELAEELITLCDEQTAITRAAASPGRFTWNVVAQRADTLYREALS